MAGSEWARVSRHQSGMKFPTFKHCFSVMLGGLARKKGSKSVLSEFLSLCRVVVKCQRSVQPLTVDCTRVRGE